MPKRPTPGYIALQETFKRNAILEAEEKDKKELIKKAKKEQDKRAEDAASSFRDKAAKKEKVQKEWADFRYKVKTDILESVLSAIVQRSLPKTINEVNFVNNIVKDFVEKEETYTLLNRMSNKTEFLSELAFRINEAADEAVENVDEREPDSYVADESPKVALITDIKGDEQMEDINDIIRDRVSRATQDFMEKNIIDQQEIKDTLMDTKEKIAAVKTGDDAMDAELREHYEEQARRTIKEIDSRPNTIYEQLIKNIATAVLTNESIKESYTYEGTLLMESIANKATCIYTLMETISTLKLKKFDESSIEEFIQFS